MKCTGRYKDVSIDFQTMKQILMLEVNDNVAGQFIELKEKEKLDIEIKPTGKGEVLMPMPIFTFL